MSSLTSDLTPLRLVWLALAICGAIAGFVWPRPPEWVALAALAIWCLVETGLRRNWLALLTFPAMWPGLGCALPLYLFFRSRRIA